MLSSSISFYETNQDPGRFWFPKAPVRNRIRVSCFLWTLSPWQSRPWVNYNKGKKGRVRVCGSHLSLPPSNTSLGGGQWNSRLASPVPSPSAKCSPVPRAHGASISALFLGMPVVAPVGCMMDKSLLCLVPILFMLVRLLIAWFE